MAYIKSGGKSKHQVAGIGGIVREPEKPWLRAFPPLMKFYSVLEQTFQIDLIQQTSVLF